MPEAGSYEERMALKEEGSLLWQATFVDTQRALASEVLGYRRERSALASRSSTHAAFRARAAGAWLCAKQAAEHAARLGSRRGRRCCAGKPWWGSVGSFGSTAWPADGPRGSGRVVQPFTTAVGSSAARLRQWEREGAESAARFSDAHLAARRFACWREAIAAAAEREQPGRRWADLAGSRPRAPRGTLWLGRARRLTCQNCRRYASPKGSRRVACSERMFRACEPRAKAALGGDARSCWGAAGGAR